MIPKITLLERAPGVWRIRTELPKLADGERRFAPTETVRGTRRDAEARKAELLAQYVAAPGVEPSRAKLADYLKEWTAQRLILKAITTRTAEGYDHLREKMVEAHPIGAIRIDRLMPTDLARWLADMAKHYGPRSLLHGLAMVRTALKAAHRERRIPFNAAELVEPPRQDTAPPRAMDTSEVGRVLAAADADRNGDIVKLALATGMRRGEIGGLFWDCVDLDGGLLLVRRAIERLNRGQNIKAPKTAAGVRDIPLAPHMVEMLRARRVEAAKVALAGGTPIGELPVFPGRGGGVMNLSSISQVFERIAAAAGVKARLHDCRHSFVTASLRAGEPTALVSQRAGHAGIAVTLSVYSHVLKEDAGRVVDPFASLAAKKGGA